jgi:hypothetical protein
MSNFSVVFRVMTHHPADGGRRQLLTRKTLFEIAKQARST